MSSRSIPPGFQAIRHDRLLQEYQHDSYKTKGHLAEPSVCPQCGAVFHGGRWRWGEAPPQAHAATCPACHRIGDDYPAGFVFLAGPFFTAHREEAMHLIRHEEQREKAEHPLQRIMAVEEGDGEVLVKTTDVHLARRIGEAVHRAFQGELEFHYNPEENRLRVYWTR